MIRVMIGTNMKRNTINFPHNTTLRAALESQDIDYSVGLTSIDGATLGPGDLNKTFAELGFDGSEGRDKASLLCVVD